MSEFQGYAGAPMQPAAVIPLRRSAPSHEIEEKLIGAVLELPDKLELMDASGLSRASFSQPRCAVVWMIMRRLSERKLGVNAVTVVSAGKRAQLLADSDLRWLTDVQEANVLTRDQALQVAEDVRIQARAREIRGALMQQVDLIDRGRFAPGHCTDALNTIVSGLALDFARDETAEADLLALNASWDRNVEQGIASYDKTGIRVLDEMIGGHPKNLFMIQGAPGVGKNAYVSTVLPAQLRLDAHLGPDHWSRTGLIGLESGTKWLTNRMQAEALGIPIREVGSRKLTPEQLDRKARVDQEHFELLKRVEIFSGHGVHRSELIRRAMRWVFTKGVQRIYVDNLREIRHHDPRQRMEWWQAVAETVRAWRDFAERYEIPVGILVHDTEERAKPGHELPPDPDKMMGGRDAGARARLVIGLWSKGSSVRATITKANDLAEAKWPNGPTMEFQRNFEAGTFAPDGGRRIDVDAERAEERRNKRHQALEQSVDDGFERDAMRKKRKGSDLAVDGKANSAGDEKKTEPQSALDLGAMQTTKPEGT